MSIKMEPEVQPKGKYVSKLPHRGPRGTLNHIPPLRTKSDPNGSQGSVKTPTGTDLPKGQDNWNHKKAST